MKNYLKILLVLPFCFVIIFSCSGSANSRISDVDFETWYGIAVNYQWNKHWHASIKEQIRLEGKAFNYQRVFTEIQLEYRFRIPVEIGYEYRYIFLNDTKGSDVGNEKHSRVGFYCAHKFKINRLSSKNRLVFQNKKEVFNDFAFCRRNSKSCTRIRSKLSYNIKNWKWDPTIAGEYFFYGWNPERGQNNKYRISVGINHKIKGSKEIKFKYHYEKELRGWYPEVKHNICVEYCFNYKRKES